MINSLSLSIIKILPKRTADIYIKLKSITSKLHKTSASTAFIKKAFVDVIPKFAIVKGQFINENMNDGEFMNYTWMTFLFSGQNI